MPPAASRSIATYYDALRSFNQQGATPEGATHIAFQTLLADVGRSRGFTVLAEQTITLASSDRSDQASPAI